MDVHSPSQRKYNMSRIKSKDTEPEIIIRHRLWKNGYRYRLHYKGLPGKPDIVFVKQKKVIFINGCFWHQHDCRYFKWPKTNASFWKNKILDNSARDKDTYSELEANGWRYFVVWECQIKNKSFETTLRKIIIFIDR
jgi:DNA mismatch endonuclease (patch repair protein)